MPAGDDWGPFNIGHDLEWRWVEVTSYNDDTAQFIKSTRKIAKSETYVAPPKVVSPPGQRGIKLRDDA